MQLLLPSQTITTVGAVVTVEWARANDPTVFAFVESIACVIACTSVPAIVATVTDDSPGSQTEVAFSNLGTVGLFAYSFVVGSDGKSTLAESPFAAANNAMTVTPVSPNASPTTSIPSVTSRTTPESTSSSQSSESQNRSTNPPAPTIAQNTSSSSSSPSPPLRPENSPTLLSTSSGSTISSSTPQSQGPSNSTAISVSISSSAVSPTQQVSTSDLSSSGNKHRISPGIISGAAVGGTIVTIIVTILAVLFFRRRRRRNVHGTQSEPHRAGKSKKRSHPGPKAVWPYDLKHVMDAEETQPSGSSGLVSNLGTGTITVPGTEARQMRDLTTLRIGVGTTSVTTSTGRWGEADQSASASSSTARLVPFQPEHVVEIQRPSSSVGRVLGQLQSRRIETRDQPWLMSDDVMDDRPPTYF